MVAHGYLLPTRGVVLSADGPETLTALVESDVVGLARRAETLGFDGVWAGDSVLAKPRLAPLTTLAALATATDAVRLGTAVYLPALRHAVTFAHRAATLDLLAGGRLALGVGVGVRPTERTEHEQLGVDFERRGRRLDETLEVARALWTGEAVAHAGEWYDLSDASIGFGPVGDLPVYAASAAFDPARGFPRPVRERIAHRADGWLPIAIPPATYEAGLERAREAVADAGRDPAALEPAYYQDVVIADTEAEALDEARAFLRAYYPDDELTYLPEEPFSDDRLRERGVFGPPERVREHVDRYADAGVERFVTRFPASDQRGQLRRFADVIG